MRESETSASCRIRHSRVLSSSNALLSFPLSFHLFLSDEETRGLLLGEPRVAARREFASVFERKEHSQPSRLIPVRMQDTQDPLSRTRERALVLPCLFMLTFYGSYEPDFLADVPLLN